MSAISTKVFVPDDQFVWLEAEVLSESLEEGVVTVQISDSSFHSSDKERMVSLGKHNLTALPLHNTDIPSTGVDDMCTLNYLHEPSILDNLRRRFESKLPYTYTGDICVAVNPYHWLDIYTPSLREKYSKGRREDLPPHVYATSSVAYRGLTMNQKNQSILVSGESGAGKTETVKILMGHCAYIASRQGDRTIDKLLKANPLLESFGNAKTARNDNSSRFGKFSQLEFDDSYTLVGSKCVTYLLEKSRVVSLSPLERNYHILYQLLSAPEDVKKQFHLNGLSAKHFQYTAGGDTSTDTIEGIADKDRFVLTQEALTLLGVGETLTSLLFDALAGLLFLGEVRFAGNEDTAIIDLTSSSDLENCVMNCCRLLGLPHDQFYSTIVSRTIDVQGKKILVPLNVEQAVGGRDALSKELYARVFQWLVHVINFNTSYSGREPTVKHSNGAATSSISVTSPDKLGSPSKSSRKQLYKKPQCSTISLLDIFGFESFESNHFEQLCINFANEKLQQKFTLDVFKIVQAEYEDEGLQWDHITYQDNASVLELIEGRKGIIHCLNEECLVPKGSDSTFLSKTKTACVNHHAFFVHPTSKDQFTITHYAGKVTYSVPGFMDRNKDNLPEDMRVLMSGSSNPLLAKIFADGGFFSARGGDSDDLLCQDKAFGESYLLLDLDRVDDDGLCSEPRMSISGFLESGESRKPKRRNSFMMAETVTTKFKNQLTKLMETISATEVQYVRCIKPNKSKSSVIFDRAMVVEQLRSAGMIEAIRISRAAYPFRLHYGEFLRRYRCLRPRSWYAIQLSVLEEQFEVSDESDHYPDLCKALLMSFMKTIEMKPLVAEADYVEVDDNVFDKYMDFFQFGRTKVYFSNFLSERLEGQRQQSIGLYAIEIQRLARRGVARRKFLRMKCSAIVVQSLIRRYQAVGFYRFQIYTITKIQSIFRVALAKTLLRSRRDKRAATKIQALSRCRRCFALYHQMKKSAILIQSLMKMRRQREKYVVVRDQARRFADLQSRCGVYEEKLLEAEKLRAERELYWSELLVVEKSAVAAEIVKVAALESQVKDLAAKVQTQAEIESQRTELVARVEDLEEKVRHLDGLLVLRNEVISNKDCAIEELQRKLSDEQEARFKDRKERDEREFELADEVRQREDALSKQEIDISNLRRELDTSTAALLKAQAEIEETVQKSNEMEALLISVTAESQNNVVLNENERNGWLNREKQLTLEISNFQLELNSLHEKFCVSESEKLSAVECQRQLEDRVAELEASLESTVAELGSSQELNEELSARLEIQSMTTSPRVATAAAFFGEEEDVQVTKTTDDITPSTNDDNLQQVAVLKKTLEESAEKLLIVQSERDFLEDKLSQITAELLVTQDKLRETQQSSHFTEQEKIAIALSEGNSNEKSSERHVLEELRRKTDAECQRKLAEARAECQRILTEAQAEAAEMRRKSVHFNEASPLSERAIQMAESKQEIPEPVVQKTIPAHPLEPGKESVGGDAVQTQPPSQARRPSQRRNSGPSSTLQPQIPETSAQQFIQELMDGKGLMSKIYLSSKTGGVMEKVAVIHRRIPENADGKVLFECELTGNDAQVKKLKFWADDLRAVRKGKGKTISVTETDRLCMNINIEGKGELNMSLSSEMERDAAIRFFKMNMSTNKSTESAETKTGAPDVLAPPPLPKPPSKKVVVVKQGWVTKEDTKQTHLIKSWTKRFLSLERGASKILKYASSPNVINFPTQVKGFIHITGSMLCVPISRNENFLVELFDGNLLKLRMQVETAEDQLDWIHAIQSVIEEAAAEE